MAFDSTWFGQVFIRELEYIRRRRDPQNAQSETKPRAAKETTVGISLSGGGIRSATTNLGILQALSKMGILPLVDYVSTVSGGGYIGSCLTSLLSLPESEQRRQKWPGVLRRGDAPLFTTEWDQFPFNPETTLGAAQIRHLRTHGSFLVTRKGFLKRETMRSIGNLLSGTVYHLVLVLLTLVTAALLYLCVLFSAAPSIDQSLRALTAPVASYATAYEGRIEGPTRPERDPAQSGGPATVKDATPTYVQSTVYTYPGLTDVLKAKWNTLLGEVSSRAAANRVVPLLTVLFGILVAVAAFVYLRQYGVARRRPKLEIEPKAGESVRGRARDTRLVARRHRIRARAGGVAGCDPDRRETRSPLAAAARPRCRGAQGHDVGHPRRASPAERSVDARHALALGRLPGHGHLRDVDGGSPRDIPDRRLRAAGIRGMGRPLRHRIVDRRAIRDVTARPGRQAEAAVGDGASLGAGHRDRGRRPLRPDCAVRRLRPAEPVTDDEDRGVDEPRLGIGRRRPSRHPGLSAATSTVCRRTTSIATAWRKRTCTRKIGGSGIASLKTMRDHIELPLKDLHYRDLADEAEAAPTAPYHLISCAINLAASRDLTRKDRKSGYFLFSKFFCGSRAHRLHRHTSTIAAATSSSRAP